MPGRSSRTTTWPEVISHVADLKTDLEKTTYKAIAITNWGHPCIDQGGFKWDLKKLSAYPCMYQNKIKGEQIYRAKALWDAGNDVYATFLDAKEWYKLTQQDFGNEAKGGWWSFSASSGRSDLITQRVSSTRAPASGKASTGG